MTPPAEDPKLAETGKSHWPNKLENIQYILTALFTLLTKDLKGQLHMIFTFKTLLPIPLLWSPLPVFSERCASLVCKSYVNKTLFYLWERSPRVLVALRTTKMFPIMTVADERYSNKGMQNSQEKLPDSLEFEGQKKASYTDKLSRSRERKQSKSGKRRESPWTAKPGRPPISLRKKKYSY